MGKDLYTRKVRDLTIRAGINEETNEPSLILGTGKINSMAERKNTKSGHTYLVLKMDGFDKLTAIVSAILTVTKEMDKGSNVHVMKRKGVEKK